MQHAILESVHREAPGRPSGCRHAAGSGKPVGHVFFVAAYCCGFLGMGYMGIHLWLALNGLMTTAFDYSWLKAAHAVIQFYLFLGLICLGFLAQASGRLMSIERAVCPHALGLLAPLALGLVLLLIDPRSALARTCFSLSYFVFTLHLLMRYRRAEPGRFLSTGVPILLGLAAFSGGAYLDLSLPTPALLLFWAALVPILLGAGQHFVRWLFAGEELSPRAARIFIGLSVAASALIAAIVWFPRYASLLWPAFAALAGACFAFHTWATKAWRCVSAPRSPLRFAFLLGNIWAVIGCMFLWRGPLHADFALHSWANGWAVTLVIGVTLQIMTGLAAKPPFRPALAYATLALWQLVPLGRTILHTSGSGLMAYIVAIAATLVLVIWGYAILSGAAQVRTARAGHGHASAGFPVKSPA